MLLNFDAAAELVPHGFFIFDPLAQKNGAFLYTSAKFSDITGLSSQALLSDATAFFDRLDSRDYEQFVQHSRQALEDGLWEMELHFLHLKNDPIVLQWRAMPIQEKERTLFKGTLLDIAEQTDTKQTFRSIAESSSDNIVRYDREGRIQYINKSLLDFFNYDGTFMYLGKKARDLFPDGRFDTITSAADRVSQSGNKEYVELVLQISPTQTFYHHISVVPEYNEAGDIIGSIAFGRDITPLKQLELQLREQNTFHKTLLNALNKVGMQLMIIEEGKIIYVSNLNIAQKFGYDEATITSGVPFLDIIHPDDKERIAQYYKYRMSHHNDTPNAYEVGLIDKMGQRHEYEVFVTPIPDTHPPRLISIGKDITKRKAAEYELKLMQQAVNQSSEALFMADATTWKFLYVDDAACSSLGYSREELLEKSIMDVNPDYTTNTMSVTFNDISDGSHFTFETRHKRKDGTIFPVEVNGSFFEKDGILYNVAMVRDISERKEAEQRLAQSEEKFRSLAENLPDLIVRYDKAHRRIYANPTYTRMLNITSEEAMGKTPTQLWSMPGSHPNAQEYEGYLDTILTSGKPEIKELQWKLPDGREIVLDFHGVPEFDQNGKVESVLTVARDISRQRMMESELRMAASVFKVAGEGIMITDPNGLILDVNPAFSTISGYSKKDAVEKKANILSSGMQEKDFYTSMWSQLLKSGSWSGEIVNQRKDGSRYIEHLDIIAIYDEADTLKYYVGIFSDVTQLKHQEEYLTHIAHHDNLTGLPNRMLLTDRLSMAMAYTKRSNKILGIIYLDLDGFKPVNDTYGHKMGDKVLIEIARRMLKIVRQNDTVSRIGGDEFVVLLGELENRHECKYIVERLLDTISQPILIEHYQMLLSASIGIRLYEGNKDEDGDLLLRQADQAMYAAKADGRSRYIFSEFNP